MNRMESNKNKKSNFLVEYNRIFGCVGHKKQLPCYQPIFYLRIKRDTLVNIQTNFYKKRMRITIKIISTKNATFNIGHPLYKNG